MSFPQRVFFLVIFLRDPLLDVGMKSSRKVCTLDAEGREIPVELRKHPWAKRYTIRVHHDGKVMVTFPNWGSFKQAAQFAKEQTTWLKTKLDRIVEPTPIVPGTKVLYRGEREVIEVDSEKNGYIIRFGDQSFKLSDLPEDLQFSIERHLRKVSALELRTRTSELASFHGIRIEKIRIGAQRSRWGSCSSTGTISLNWRLIQTPLFVRDYIILHELVHRIHMNHSSSFWETIDFVCPNYLEAEHWLKSNKGIPS